MALASAGCIYDNLGIVTHGESVPSVRRKSSDVSVAAAEGLAVSRIVASPAMIPMVGVGEFVVNDQNDYFNRVLKGVLGAVVEAPVLMVQEIGAGVVELVSFQQFKSLYYPWEAYSQKKGRDKTDVAIRAKEEYKREHPNPNAEFWGDFVEGMAEAAPEIVESTINAGMEKNGGGSLDGGGGAGGGYGSISGPTNLGVGKSGVYYLHVGGKKVSAEWAQNGTSISVYGRGGHARVVAGNPPLRGGKFKTGIRATYNGKTYTKAIYILK